MFRVSSFADVEEGHRRESEHGCCREPDDCPVLGRTVDASFPPLHLSCARYSS